jgi:type III pantothenate kinase
MAENQNTILAIDIGNSSIHWNFITDGKVDEYKRNKHTELSLFPWQKVKEINCPVVIAGMLPHMNDAIQTIAKDYKIKFVEINISNQGIIKNTYPTIGIDRVLNLISALNSFKELNSPIVVFDFGSATTVTSCDKNGNFSGGLIKAGFELELKGLSTLTFSLPHVQLAREQKITKLNALTRETEDAILHGVITGQIAFIDYYLKMFENEQVKPKVIFTGGNSSIVAKFYKNFDLIDPLLTLKGIYHCYQSSLVRK